MPATVIVGAQWGDEGKGKVVDLLAEKADLVVRYAGGPNAGHTLVVGDRKVVLRLVPSGALQPHVRCLLGQGMVLDARTLVQELDALKERGVELDGRLGLSPYAHLILPYHVTLDELRESSTRGTRLGTTRRGIGPCYEDKAARRGVRLADIADPTRLLERVSEALDAWAPVFASHGVEPPRANDAASAVLDHVERLRPLLADTSLELDEALRGGKRAMLEGAQGTMLDLDHGTYPYVTSSSAVAGGACTGAGIGPTRIDKVLGITKAYATRVGEGPFPTELGDARGTHLREVGREFGSVTGRPRRTGWLDVAALRYARRVNGLDGLALTKLDVLSGLDEVALCVGYATPAGVSPELTPELVGAQPVLATFAGWSGSLADARTLEDLPSAARRYLDAVEQMTELPLCLVSVGPHRHETIVLRDGLA